MTTLSPSLQSYLDVNNNNVPSWAGGSSSFSPYLQPNPTSIRRVDIARTVRRHDPSWARKRSSGSLYHGAMSLGPSTHATPGPHARSISDRKAANPTPYLRRAVPLNAQFRDILERGWDGRMTLGRRTGGERRLLAAHLSTSARYGTATHNNAFTVRTYMRLVGFVMCSTSVCIRCDIPGTRLSSPLIYDTYAQHTDAGNAWCSRIPFWLHEQSVEPPCTYEYQVSFMLDEQDTAVRSEIHRAAAWYPAPCFVDWATWTRGR